MNPAAYAKCELGGDRWMLLAVAKKDADFPDSFDIENHLLGVEEIEISNLKIFAKGIMKSDIPTLSSEDSLRSFGEALNGLHSSVDILPFRFGVFLSQPEILSSIVENESGYLASLSRIENCSEINIRWAFPESRLSKVHESEPIDHRAHQSGFHYLQQKLERKQEELRLQSDLEHLCSQLREQYPDAIQAAHTSVGNQRLADGHHNHQVYIVPKLDLLARRSAVGSLLSLSNQFLLRHEPPTVASGPWPPFSFIESEEISEAA